MEQGTSEVGFKEWSVFKQRNTIKKKLRIKTHIWFQSYIILPHYVPKTQNTLHETKGRRLGPDHGKPRVTTKVSSADKS